MEAQTNARRWRRQAGGLSPDFVPPAEESAVEAAEQTEQAEEPDSAAEESPRERSFQDRFDAIPPEALHAATEPLRPEERVCVCMDDRNPDDGVYSAGGMILLDTDAAVEQIRALGVTALKSHPGCGAGAVLAARLGRPAEQGDAVAVEQSMRLAKEAGVRYAGASAVDAEIPHAARATFVFVDIPVRRSQLAAYLPRAFYLSGDAYPSREALIAEALLSVRIALEAGDGASDSFSREDPFAVVFVGRDPALVRTLAAVVGARMQAVLPVGLSERIRVATVC